MEVRVGLWRKLSAEELMLLNCGVGEDSWESIGLQGDQPVHPKGNQFWIFIGRTDVKAETSTLWPPGGKNRLIWKDPDAGKDWRHEEKGTTEDEMVGWQHWLIGYEFEEAPGVGDVQGSLACCSPWGPKESATIEQLNWNDFPVYTNTNFKSISLNTNDRVKHSHSHENYICQITFSLSRFLFIHQTFIEHLVWTTAYAPTIGKRMKKTVLILRSLESGWG